MTIVEIDGAVIDACQQALPKIAQGAFDDLRSHIVIADSSRYVKETEDRFDLIIIDVPYRHGPSEALFSAEFFADCKLCLKDNGLMVVPATTPFLHPDGMRDVYRWTKPSFSHVSFYTTTVPSYFGGLMAFALASDDASIYQLTVDEIRERLETSGGAADYCTPDLHLAAFQLPSALQQLFGRHRD